MKSRVLIVALVLMTSTCSGVHGHSGREIYRRIYNDLLNVFEMAYTISEPFGLHSKSIYLLSTYVTQYSQALEACKAIKGHLAEINSAMEFTFVSDFLRTYTQDEDAVFISGYRTANYGSFISSLRTNMGYQVNAFIENRGNSRVYTNSSLYVYFHPNKPSFQGQMPTCLSIERRGSTIAMSNGRCDHTSYHRYLCSVEL